MRKNTLAAIAMSPQTTPATMPPIVAPDNLELESDAAEEIGRPWEDWLAVDVVETVDVVEVLAMVTEVVAGMLDAEKIPRSSSHKVS
jgi:hypothetical protein